ncbi:MAG: FdhF/YdeP family oxidoreductase [Candidatus Hydrogenedentes bacterium]|nr:FdhF/YdeP family oxidoreductase [Candidatus Hydrogenedentota bacterium]
MSDSFKQNKRWTPANWASKVPFGLGEQGPNNFAELFRAGWENKDELAFALRILKDGVCDGCALGTSGMTDWTLDGVHLCNIRLRLLRLNTMPALDPALLHNVAPLRDMTSAELRDLGRLPYPMLRARGEKGFRRITWNEALDLVAGRIRRSTPERFACYLTSRGVPNETYYAAQKAVRALGSNNIDNAARICHSPSTSALKTTVGAGATTCSYTDWIKSDLVVFFGSNMANNQPVATKYIHYAKKNGAKVVAINNYEEPGMARYWIPSIPESALFGTKIADRFFLVNVGSDIAFINGTLKYILENDWIDRDFVENHSADFETLKTVLAAQSFEMLEASCGATRADMLEFAKMIHEAKRAVFVWSMGITQHVQGVNNVRSIINLALTKGFVGREGCGLMPIRGHSGVQGGAEMGAYATAFPGGLPVNTENAAALAAQWGFPVPDAPGMGATQMIEAADRGEVDVLFSVGGNFLEVLPDPPFVEQALEKVPLRLHMDIVLSPQMFVDSGEHTLLLPATTRYEMPGGVTETSTERRIIFSPEIPGRRIGEARPEWQVFLDLARRVKPDLAEKLQFLNTAAIRDEIARVVPFYEGIQHLKEKGDQFQYGGAHLCADWTFGTPDGKAHFFAIEPENTAIPEGQFSLTTRRGKQFNSMVHAVTDRITGAEREAILMHPDDAKALGVKSGDRLRLSNNFGSMDGHVYLAPVLPRNLQVHWPEGNTLLDRTRTAREAGVPDYNAHVTVTPLKENQPS